jgi:hypothetical protein
MMVGIGEGRVVGAFDGTTDGTGEGKGVGACNGTAEGIGVGFNEGAAFPSANKVVSIFPQFMEPSPIVKIINMYEFVDMFEIKDDIKSA